MEDTKLILECKDKPTLDAVIEIFTASGIIAENEIEAREEKNNKLCLYGARHFTVDQLEEFVGE